MPRTEPIAWRSAGRAVIVASLFLVSGASVGLAEPRLDASALLDGVQGWLNETRDLQGRFQQTLVSGALGAGLEESGALFLQRPGKLRMNYEEPESKQALVVGGKTSFYVEEDEQLILGELDLEVDLLPAVLTGGAPLAHAFDAEVLEGEKSKRVRYWLRLTPRRQTETLRHVTLGIQRRDFAIVTAEVLDAAGNLQRFQFSDLRRNRGIRANTFELRVPEGTDVIGSHGEGPG